MDRGQNPPSLSLSLLKQPPGRLPGTASSLYGSTGGPSASLAALGKGQSRARGPADQVPCGREAGARTGAQARRFFPPRSSSSTTAENGRMIPQVSSGCNRMKLYPQRTLGCSSPTTVWQGDLITISISQVCSQRLSLPKLVKLPSQLRARICFSSKRSRSPATQPRPFPCTHT